MSSSPGKVYIIGAGPGPASYLTVQAKALLRQADALVYDALVDATLLQLLPPHCEAVSVGKRGGQPSTPQADINQLLVQLCQQGKQVVRLKSGDPFIFGRTTAEIEALRAADCAFAVVPGLSAALAAPLLAGIPLTDPVLSHGFGVFSAHDLEALDWSLLAQLETLVLLMGGQRLGDICRCLQTHGKRGETPVAVVQWAGQPRQQIWQGTLLSIAQVTRGSRLSPCVIIIGEVIQLRPFLQPVSPMSEPLAAKTFLVTRSAGQSSQFTAQLEAQGARVIELPALEIQPPGSWQALDRAIATLGEFDWLILTSANAVTFFLERLQTLGYDLRALAGLKLAVVGKKTAAVLQQRGLKPEFIPPDYIADALVDHWPAPVAGLKILFPRVESGGRDVLVKTLTARGAAITEVAAYESGCPAAMAPAAQAAIAAGQVDGVTFASSKTVCHFAQLMAQRFGPDWQRPLTGVAIASIGPQTSQTCHELLGRVDIEAQEYTLEGLTRAIVDWATP
jgi:uroporphyrinogen III methyltransferase/synthase